MCLLGLQLDAAPPPHRRSPSSPQSREEHSLCLPKSPRGTSYVRVGWGRGEGHITKTRENKLDNQKNYSNRFHFPRARFADSLPRPFPGFQSVGNTLCLSDPVPSPRRLLSSPLASAFPLFLRFLVCWNVQQNMMNDHLSRLVYYNAGNQLHIPNIGRPAGNLYAQHKPM